MLGQLLGALSMRDQQEPIFLPNCPKPFSVFRANGVVLVSQRLQMHNHSICHYILMHADCWGVGWLLSVKIQSGSSGN